MRDYLNISLFFFILILISYLSLTPISTPDTGLPVAVIGHLGMYFLLAGALLTYFHDKKHSHIDAVMISGLTGLMIELIQSQLVYRTFDIIDIFVNFVGAGLIMLELKVPVVHKIVELEDKFLEKLR